MDVKREGSPPAGPLKPGISVNTAITTHRGAVPQEMFPAAAKLVSNGDSLHSLGNPNLVRIADHKTPTDQQHYARALRWPKAKRLRRVGRLGSSGNHSAQDTISEDVASGFAPVHKSIRRLSLSGLGLVDISPSDRPIPIGICVPKSSQLAHQTSASDLGSALEGCHDNAVERALRSSPATPTIVITPAKEESGWHFEGLGEKHQHKPASSIYSRATVQFSGTPPIGAAPPVPAMPPTPGSGQLSAVHQIPLSHGLNLDDFPPAYEKATRHSNRPSAASIVRSAPRDSTCTTFEEDIDPQSDDQISSASTTFEENESNNARSMGEKYVGRRPQDLTVETAVPTPRRSRGWWNVITTPFEMSRSSARYMRTPTSGDTEPAVPILADAARIYGISDAHTARPSDDHSKSTDLHRQSFSQTTSPLNSGFRLASQGASTQSWVSPRQDPQVDNDDISPLTSRKNFPAPLSNPQQPLPRAVPSPRVDTAHLNTSHFSRSTNSSKTFTPSSTLPCNDFSQLFHLSGVSPEDRDIVISFQPQPDSESSKPSISQMQIGESTHPPVIPKQAAFNVQEPAIDPEDPIKPKKVSISESPVFLYTKFPFDLSLHILVGRH